MSTGRQFVLYEDIEITLEDTFKLARRKIIESSGAGIFTDSKLLTSSLEDYTASLIS